MMQSYFLGGVAVVILIIILYVAYQIGRKSGYSDPRRHDTKEKQHGIEIFRVHIVNSGWDTEQAKHNSKERNYWRSSIILNYIYIILTAIAATAASCAFVQTKRQADVASNQLTLAFPPKLSVFAIHMWERGKGHEFGASNTIPIFKNGEPLDGVAFIVNKGRETAYIKSSNLVVMWMSNKINMVNPLWSSKDNILLDATEAGDQYNHPILPMIHNLEPNRANAWKFHTEVQGQTNVKGEVSETLYILGTVYYTDSTNTQHDLAFTRRYDPSRGRFVRADDATEDTENEDPLPDPEKGK